MFSKDKTYCFIETEFASVLKRFNKFIEIQIKVFKDNRDMRYEFEKIQGDIKKILDDIKSIKSQNRSQDCHESVNFICKNLKTIEGILENTDKKMSFFKDKQREEYEGIKAGFSNIKGKIKSIIDLEYQVEDLRRQIDRLKDKIEILNYITEVMGRRNGKSKRPLNLIIGKLEKKIEKNFSIAILSYYKQDNNFVIDDFFEKFPNKEIKNLKKDHPKEKFKELFVYIDNIKEGQFDKGVLPIGSLPWAEYTNMEKTNNITYVPPKNEDREQRVYQLFYDMDEEPNNKINPEDIIHLFNDVNTIYDMEFPNIANIYNLNQFKKFESSQEEVNVFTNDLYYDIEGISEIVEENLAEGTEYNYYIVRNADIIDQLKGLIEKWENLPSFKEFEKEGKRRENLRVKVYIIKSKENFPAISELVAYNLSKKKGRAAFMMFPTHVMGEKDAEDFAVRTRGKVEEIIFKFFDDLKEDATEYNWDNFLNMDFSDEQEQES